MKPNKEKIYDFIRLHTNKSNQGVSTQYIADTFQMQRTNVSSILGRLLEEGRVVKKNGRPVLYSIHDSMMETKDSCFEQLVGAHGSLQRVVQLAKAAVLYPEKSLNSMIIGAKGTGKSYLTKLMYQFAAENGIISAKSELVSIDCRGYAQENERLIPTLFGDEHQQGLYQKAFGGVLYIDHIQCLSTYHRQLLVRELLRSKEVEKENYAQDPIIIVSSDTTSLTAEEDFASEFLITIELPVLNKRPLSERLELIQKFVALEAARIKRTLIIKDELLRCLLLYDCEANCKQLKVDIKIGCANAYVREFKSNEQLQLYISDFEHHVRKGFLKYQYFREELDQLIPPTYNYAFEEETYQRNINQTRGKKDDTIYDKLSKRAKQLNEIGLDETEINLVLSTEVEQMIKDYQKSLTREVINLDQLAILVDQQLIHIAEQFIQEAEQRLGRQYPESTLCSLCLHIHSIIHQNECEKTIQPKQIRTVLSNYEQEYQLSMQLAAKLKETYQKDLQMEDLLVITMFLSYQAPIADLSNKPVLLFAYYGEGVAKSIAEIIRNLTHLDNVFYFELAFEKNPEEVYEALAKYIRNINRGKGVIVIYDGNLVSKMLISIEAELNLVIRQLHLPITTIGTELARTAALNDNIDVVYQSVMDHMDLFDIKLKKIIVAICTTGKGSAEELKRYIMQYGNVEDMEVVTLAMTNPETIKEELAILMKRGTIQCLVGTYDPKLYSLPFISISEVFGIPKERLPARLRMNYEEKKKIDYDAMMEYLKEQLEYTDTDRLKKYLSNLMKEVDEKICELSLDTEVGLFIHIACCIERLIKGAKTPVNLRKEMILSKYNIQFKKLLRLLKPIEKAFGVIMNDDEVANILTIVYKL